MHGTAGTGFQPGQQPGPKPRSRDRFFNSIRFSGYYRPSERIIGGVSAGVARKWGLDPILMRGLFIIAAFMGGIGLLVYAVLWALLPDEKDGRIVTEELFNGNPDASLIGIVLMILFGVGALPTPFFFGWPIGGDDIVSGHFYGLGGIGYFFLILLCISMGIAWTWWLCREVYYYRTKRAFTGMAIMAGASILVMLPFAVLNSVSGYHRLVTIIIAIAGMMGWGSIPFVLVAMFITYLVRNSKAKDAAFAAAYGPQTPGASQGAPPPWAMSGTAPSSAPGTPGSFSAAHVPPAFMAAANPAAGSSTDSPSASTQGRTTPMSYPTPAWQAPQTPPPAWQAPNDVTPGRPGPGNTLSLVILALAFLVAAGLSLFSMLAGFRLSLIPIGIGLMLLVFAIGMIVAALMGRRGTWMSVMAALVATCLALPAALTFAVVPAAARTIATSSGTWALGDIYLDATSQNTSLAAGEVSLDLRNIPESALGKSIDINIGAGSLEIITRANQPVTVDVGLGVGEVFLASSGQWSGPDLMQGSEGLPFFHLRDFNVSSKPFTSYPGRAYTVDGALINQGETSMSVNWPNTRSDGEGLNTTLTNEAGIKATQNFRVTARVGAGEIKIIEKTDKTYWTGAVSASGHFLIESWIDEAGKEHRGTIMPGTEKRGIVYGDLYYGYSDHDGNRNPGPLHGCDLPSLQRSECGVAWKDDDGDGFNDGYNVPQPRFGDSEEFDGEDYEDNVPGDSGERQRLHGTKMQSPTPSPATPGSGEPTPTVTVTVTETPSF